MAHDFVVRSVMLLIIGTAGTTVPASGCRAVSLTPQGPVQPGGRC